MVLTLLLHLVMNITTGCGDYGTIIMEEFIRLIPTILILLSSILLTIIANRLRVGRKYIKDVENKLIGYGVILILAPIIFVLGYNLYSEGYDIFITYIEYPGFAFIAPFIGGALALVGGIFSKYRISEEEKD